MAAGAVMGGVAAATLSAPGAAEAANGDPVLSGTGNDTTATTGLRIGGAAGAEAPSLALENENGPSLYLQPLDAAFAGFMELGQVANTTLGPVVGVDTVMGRSTTFLATGVDLADLPTPYALPAPIQVLDTRNPDGRARIVASSPAAFTAAGRLHAHAYLDVEVAPVAGDFQLPSVYLNVQAVSAKGNGSLTVYQPGQSVPAATTLSYQKRRTVANLALVATGIVRGRFVVRIYASATTHVVADLTGFTVKGDSPTPQAAANGAQQRDSAAASKATRAVLGARLRSTLVEGVRSRLGR